VSDNPISDIAEGQRKAELNWTKEQILGFIKDAKDGKIGIVNEISSAYQSVKIQRSSSEWGLYSPYIKNPIFRKLANFGLQLRLCGKNMDRVRFLQGKINKKYGIPGWHIAEFVANKILSKFIVSLIDANKTAQQLTIEVEQILSNIERDVTFIHSNTDVKTEAENIITKLNVLSPDLHILTSKGSMTTKCRNIALMVKENTKNYRPEDFSDNDEYVVFFKKVPNIARNFP